MTLALAAAAWLNRSMAEPPVMKETAGKPAATNAVAQLIGRRVSNFVVKDAGGQTKSLADYADKQAVVLVFVSSQCPIANEYLPIIEELAKKFADRSVQFLTVYSSPSDTAEKVAAQQKQFKLTLPALFDHDQQVLESVGAERTAEAFVLDARGVIRYHGRIDDRYGYEYHRDTPKRNDLEIAINELLEHKKVSISSTSAQGCLFGHCERGLADRTKGKVTYCNQVVRVLQDKCQSCHRPGTAAPFSLLEPAAAMHWSEMIREVVLQRRMPPWHADPRFGQFSNDRRLSQEQLDTLVAWVDAGTPMGDKSQLPPRREFAEGWTIGKPDVVFELPREVTVPASGTVPYQYFETPTNFKQDMWVQAAEARPGNRAAVHHIIAFYRDPNGSKHRIEDQWIAGTAPGDMALVLPPGVGRRIPAGATIVWQVHYTPTGKEEKDRSQLGLIFCKGPEPPKYNVATHGIGNHRFLIPPGDANFEVDAEMKLPQDVTILSFMPHMHLRGKDFLYRAVYPDGHSETLLSVPRYSFAWQSNYRCAKPIHLPKGTRLECVAHFDNSADNPANPDPTKAIRWGDQTWDEMMIGYVDYIAGNATRL
ncbi:MAG TPA: redoxin domain-containing protein [Pirellulales bacterium]|nr:redoxin domain-containing protein [Pirellulales bacterium]